MHGLTDTAAFVPPSVPFRQQLVRDWPPLVDELDKALGVRKIKGPIFSWGRLIYVPHEGNLTPELWAHEAVHGIRQIDIGVEQWWKLYMEHLQFRLAEEVLAHAAEYAHFCKYQRKSRHQGYLNFVARRLSSPLYGRLISFGQARDAILSCGSQVRKVGEGTCQS